MVFQVCNVPHPNSPDNTWAFCVFEAADKVTDLHIALDRYKEQIDRIESQTWRYECVSCSYICDKHQHYNLIILTHRGKRIRVFLCGDYELLTRTYGLSGASGKC